MATKITSTVNNFAHGKADHDLNGRYDIPIYSSSCDVFRNFTSNFKGNAVYSPGFENIMKFEDCAFILFRFTSEQSYLLLLTEYKIKFLTYDASGAIGLVQSGGSDLEITTPYTLEDAKELKYDQNADVMYLVHSDYEPRKLTRTSSTSFTLSTYTRTSDPFDDPSTGTTGYPSAVRFYKGRLWFANATLKPTKLFGSQLADYDNFDTGTALDDEAIIIEASDIAEPIEWLMDGYNSLIGGSTEACIAINGGQNGDKITPDTVEVSVTNTDGSASTQPIRKDELMFYIRHDNRTLNYFRYDILTESFKARDVNFISYDITVGGISSLHHKRGREDLIYTLRDDGALLSLNFNEEEKIIAWHEHERQGLFKQICVMPNNEGVQQLFALMKKDSDYFICRQSEVVEFPLQDTFYTGDEDADKNAQIRFYAEKLKDCNYLDISSRVRNLYTTIISYSGDTSVGSIGTISSTGTNFSSGDVGEKIIYKTKTGKEVGYFEIISFTSATEVGVKVLYTPTTSTYDSWYKTFDTITGLTDFIGDTISVVGDGGYLGDFTVNSSGEVSLGKSMTNVWFGFKYDGLIKTFDLGFQVQGINLQTTLKRLTSAGVRFVFSAGGKIGTSLYNMENIQEFDPTGLYDNPPNPMDGTQLIEYDDEYETSKYLYIKQDKPLPLNLTALMATVTYSLIN